MGYYSLYKIIKDVIRTIFGNKVFRVFLIVVILLLLFCIKNNKVYAADVNTDSFFGYDISFNEDLFGDLNYIMYLYKQGDYLGVDLYVSNYYDLNKLSSGTSTGYTVTIPTGYIFTSRQGELGRISNFNSASASTALNNFITACMNNYNTQNPNTSNKTTYILKRGNYPAGSFYSNKTIYVGNNPIFEPTINPEIATSLEDLQTLNFDVLSVNGWDYSNEDLYLLVYDRNYENTDSFYNLYPVKEILLNQESEYFMSELSSDPSENAIYWIDKGDLGLNWKVGGSYGFKFAIRENVESDFSDWTYHYLGDEVEFTVNSNVSSETINSFNSATQEKKDDEEHQQTIDALNGQTDAINNQTQQDSEFYNNILSNDYDENTAGNTFGSMTSSSDNIDNSQYVGLFSAVFGKFSNIINGDYYNVESISYPIPNTNKNITITSDILSSKIRGTSIYTFLQLFWYFLFGMYIFKFSNNLIRKIKSGEILNGYENNDEVITSTML